MDRDGNGTITHDEFVESMVDPAMANRMALLGVSLHDTELLFAALDGDGSESISIPG